MYALGYREAAFITMLSHPVPTWWPLICFVGFYSNYNYQIYKIQIVELLMESPL